MDAAGELAQLPDRDLELGRGRVGRGDRLVVRPVRSRRGAIASSRRASDSETSRCWAPSCRSRSSRRRSASVASTILRSRPPQLGLGGALVGEVADDRGDLVRPARRDPRLEVAPAGRQVEREVVGLELAAVEGRGRRRRAPPRSRRRTSGRGVAGRSIASGPTRPRRRRPDRDVEVAAIAREAEHPVGDGVDERLEAVLALAVEADQQGDRDRGRREVLRRDEDRADVVGDVGDPADDVDQRGSRGRPARRRGPAAGPAASGPAR